VAYLTGTRQLAERVQDEAARLGLEVVRFAGKDYGGAAGRLPPSASRRGDDPSPDQRDLAGHSPDSDIEALHAFAARRFISCAVKMRARCGAASLIVGVLVSCRGAYD
jgi:hypothetical protein